MLPWFRRKLFSKTFFVSIILALIASAAYILGWSSLLTVDKVVVIGAPTITDERTIESQIAIGEKLARLNTRSIKLSLKEIAWLESSTIQTDWLHGIVTIRVLTRKPIAISQGSLLDSTGQVFNLPGINREILPVVNAESVETRSAAVTLLVDLPKSVRKKVISVEVPGIHSISINMRIERTSSDGVLNIFWGDATNSELKVLVYQSLLELPENAKISFMDLSAPHAPIVR